MGKKSKRKSGVKNKAKKSHDQQQQVNQYDSKHGEGAFLQALIEEARKKSQERGKVWTKEQHLKHLREIDDYVRKGDWTGLMKSLRLDCDDDDDDSRSKIETELARLAQKQIQLKETVNLLKDVCEYPEEVRGRKVEESLVFPSLLDPPKKTLETEPFWAKWGAMDATLQDKLFDRLSPLALAIQQEGDESDIMIHHLRMEEAATDLINETETCLKELGLHQVGHSPLFLSFLLSQRAHSRDKRAHTLPLQNDDKNCSESLALFQSVVRDTTEAIRLATPIDQQMKGTEHHQYSDVLIPLKIRARALQALGDLEHAAADWKALAVMHRSRMNQIMDPSSKDRMNHQRNHMASSREFLETLTLIKLWKGTSRPLFDKQERMKWQRELGLGPFADNQYKCHNCGVRPSASNAVTLSLCAACQNCWYCSKKCQVQAWKEGHKEECPEWKNRRIYLNEETAAYVVDVLEEHGLVGTDEPGMVYVFVEDGATGIIFEAISDMTVGANSDDECEEGEDVEASEGEVKKEREHLDDDLDDGERAEEAATCSNSIYDLD